MSIGILIGSLLFVNCCDLVIDRLLEVRDYCPALSHVPASSEIVNADFNAFERILRGHIDKKKDVAGQIIYKVINTAIYHKK